MYDNILFLGHRGMGPSSKLYKLSLHMQKKVLPENTIPSFNQSIDRGADGIELDVFLTKDGVPVVTHDNELNKNVVGADMNGTALGLVSDFTIEELKQFDIGQGFSIPSLKDVLRFVLVKKKQINRPIIINIELKDGGAAPAVASLVNTLSDYEGLNQNDILYCSFNHDALRELRALLPDARLAASIKTKDIYGAHNVDKAFNVKPGTPYRKEYMDYLITLHDEIKLYAFDAIMWNIEPDLVHLCQQCDVHLCASLTDFRGLESDTGIEYAAFIHEKAACLKENDLMLYVKTDEPTVLGRELINREGILEFDLSDLVRAKEGIAVPERPDIMMRKPTLDSDAAKQRLEMADIGWSMFFKTPLTKFEDSGTESSLVGMHLPILN